MTLDISDTIESSDVIKTYSYDSDVLALSFALHEMRKNDESFGDLTSYSSDKFDTLASEVVHERHLEMADRCRKHFKFKMTSLSFREELTSYRRKLVEYLQQKDITKVDSDFLGLISRLPEMFDEDMVAKKVYSQCNKKYTDQEHYLVETVQLTYIDKAKFRRKIKETKKTVTGIKYWFKDQDNNAYCLYMDEYSSFHEFFDNACESGDIEVKVHGFLHEEDGFEFIRSQVGMWKFRKCL